MRIRVDATSLLLPSAGVKNYVHYWLRSLAGTAARRGDELSTYPPGLDAKGELDHSRGEGGATGNRWRLALVQFANMQGNPALNLFLAGADVFHCSQHLAHTPTWKKLTATLFDMSCWTTPQFHTPENVEATRRYGERILKKCDGIIAISQHARSDAVEILGVPEERIQVVYPGIPEVYFQVTSAEADQVRNKYKLRSPYALFVSCIEPRKNLGGLLRAWQALPESIRANNTLVIAGPFGWESDDMRSFLAEEKPGIKYLGYVAEADLPGLFAGAAVFVYPSFYEGFGLPAAQAMAAGVPVITSNRSCLPEIVADAGICVDPDRTEDLAGAIHDVLSRSELAGDLKRRGRSRAERYQWTFSAEESLDFFHEVAG